MTEEQLVNLAITAAVEAGNNILTVYHSDDFGVETKADDSPLTKADTLAHDCIVAKLTSSDIPILSEEGSSIPYSERQSWPLLWIVDPIDGTKEFIKRNGEFTVNIALIENQIPILGVVYVPVTGEVYWGAKSFGSFKYIIAADAPFMQLNPAFKLPFASEREVFTIVASRSHLSAETADFIESKRQAYGEIETISKGSSLKLCMVAEGRADCYPRFAPTMEWDTAAGHAVCRYASCMVTDMNTNNEMVYNREKLLNNWFLVERN
jgi:3'(2'), 5'-bisphosphate nucleotidase